MRGRSASTSIEHRAALIAAAYILLPSLFEKRSDKISRNRDGYAGALLHLLWKTILALKHAYDVSFFIDYGGSAVAVIGHGRDQYLCCVRPGKLCAIAATVPG